MTHRSGHRRSKINGWCHSIQLKDFCILYNTHLQDFVINVHESVDLPKEVDQLPYRFGVIKGGFNCSYSKIKSFENFPTIISGKLTLNHTHINPTTLTHMIHADRIIWRAGFNRATETFAYPDGIDHCFQYFDTRYFECNVHPHLLKMMLIKNLVKVYVLDIASINIDNTKKVFDNVLSESTCTKIINDHIETKDILVAQEQLIDAGFVKFAKW